MLTQMRRTSGARVTAATLCGAVLWLAGPCQLGQAAVQEARETSVRSAGKARALTLLERQAIRGSQLDPPPPAPTGDSAPPPPAGPADPWGFSLPDLGGYGSTSGGNQHTSIPIVGWKGKGPTIGLQLSHSSKATPDSFTTGEYKPPISHGWTHSYHVYLAGAGTVMVTVYEGDGTGRTFSQNIDGSFTAPAGVYDTLVRHMDGTYTLTRKHGLALNFNSSHKLSTIVDRNGNTVTLAYGGNGLVSTVTDAASRQLTFTYNGNNLLTTVTDPAARDFTLTYDTNNHLEEVTFPAPGTGQAQPYFAFVSTTRGVITEFRNRRGSVWALSYYLLYPKLLYSVTDPLSNTLTVDLDAQTATLEDGTELEWTTDTNGNRESLTREADAYHAAETQEWTWDSQHNLLTRTSPGGKIWEYTYDSYGNVLTVEDPLTRTDMVLVKDTYTYNSLHLPTSHVDVLGRQTDFDYDTDGNLTLVTDPLNYETAHTYSTAGLKLTTTDARGKVWEWAYDSYGNVTDSEDPLSNLSETTYNILGLPTSVTTAAGQTETITYDNLGRAKRATHEDGTYAESTFDGEGSVLTVRDENNRVVTNTYDALGRPVTVTDPLNRTTAFAYNPVGVRTSLTNARTKTTTFTTDNAGRLVLTTYPDATGESATYNLDGQLATRTDGRNYTTGYSYDVTGRLTGIDYPTGTDTAFEYLENGARSEMTDRTGTTLWVYNARDEVTQINAPQGTINSTYLATGQRYTVGRSGGPTTTYSYDDAGRLTSLTNGYSETTTFTLDAVGRCTQQVHANGTKVLSTYSATRGWLTVLEHKQSDNDVLARYEYTRDAAGHITEVAQPSDHVVEYDYDAAYQLTGEERTGTNAYSIGYTYDAAGNRLTKVQNSVTENYTYGDNNQLLTAGNKTYTYDANGNLTSVTVGTDVTTLAWDYNDKLTGITYPNSSTNSFTTNDLGHRVGLTDSGGSTSYLFDGSRVLADARADYTNGGVTGLISERAGSTSKVYHGDQLGSTRGLSNGSEAITDSREYDAWGLTIASAGSGSPFGFVGGQGYQKDPDSGLMLLGARYYDPSVGRFISRDPIGYKGGLNLYGYCHNNPVNASDPSGHIALVDDLIIIGLVVVTFAILSVVVTDPYVQDAWNTGLNDAANFVGDAYNSIGDGVRQIGDAILSVDFPWHHPKPKYLGGDPNQPLEQWEQRDHIDFHAELDKVFPRRLGKKTYDDVDPGTIDEIVGELRKHYPPPIDE